MEFPSANGQPAERSTVRAFFDQDELRRMLSCSLCSQTVQPPIYQCLGKNGYKHIACASCARNLTGGQCPGCEGVFQDESLSFERVSMEFPGACGFFEKDEVRRILTYSLCSQIVRRPLSQQCLSTAGYMHLACGSCAGNLPGGQCPRCDGIYEDGSSTFDRYTSVFKVHCSNDGCDISSDLLEYFQHEPTCPHAPTRL